LHNCASLMGQLPHNFPTLFFVFSLLTANFIQYSRFKNLEFSIKNAILESKKRGVEFVLKAQDIVVLVKLLAHPDHLDWTQQQLGTHLCLSASAINASLVRLQKSGLISVGLTNKRYQLFLPACEELLIYGVKYFFPASLGDFTAGIATSYAAPIFHSKIGVGKEPIPVWPTARGDQRGLAMDPLYHCVPDSIINYPDQAFYELLTLIDTIRQGRARERNIAVKLLKEKLQHA